MTKRGLKACALASMVGLAACNSTRAAEPNAPLAPRVACAEDVRRLESGAARMVRVPRGASADGQLWIHNVVDHPPEGQAQGTLVGARLELRGDRRSVLAWNASEGSIPSTLVLEPGTTWINVQAVVLSADRCLHAAIDLPVSSSSIGATIGMRATGADLVLRPYIEAGPATYTVRLRDLERRVDELRERRRVPASLPEAETVARP